jgi:hypothetical protein
MIFFFGYDILFVYDVRYRLWIVPILGSIEDLVMRAGGDLVMRAGDI